MSVHTASDTILEHKAKCETEEGGERYQLTVTVAYVHLQGNEKPYLSVTGATRHLIEDIPCGIVSCGCLHEDIRKHFPELALFIRFHLWDGLPMHYVENAVYWWEFLGGKSKWGSCRKALNNDFDYTDPFNPRRLTDRECRRKVRSILRDHVGFRFSEKDTGRKLLTKSIFEFLAWLYERQADIEAAFAKCLEDLKALSDRED